MIELLLFMSFFAVTAGIVVALLLATNENRIRRQTIAAVELSGVQMSQTLEQVVRTSERVLDPPAGATGSVLALQVSDSTVDPTILSLQTGALVLVRKDTVQTLSPSEVSISDFSVANTSIATNRNSLTIQFTVTRSIPLVPPFSYQRLFELTLRLFPDDDLQGNACSCPTPTCSGGTYDWDICVSDTCTDPTTILRC